ncbi:MAG: hypothetical protein JXA96_15475 [Sedimentisphaerales bacterium]|nr:hypothetical protein [Sedimentisphaerales bacterium]
MDFTTVYFLESRIQWFLFVLAVLGFIILRVSIWYNKLVRKGFSLSPLIIGDPIVGILVSFTFIIVGSTFFISSVVKSQKYAYAYRHSKVTEGIVSLSHEQSYNGGSGDVVHIGNKEFEINYFTDTPGYNFTVAHGGSLKKGVYAKVYYYNDCIVRVDVSKVGEISRN